MPLVPGQTNPCHQGGLSTKSGEASNFSRAFSRDFAWAALLPARFLLMKSLSVLILACCRL